MKKTPPFTEAVIAITYQCNLRCKMCNIWQKKNEEQTLSPELFRYLPKNLKEINITGGEPFLHPEIVTITKQIAAACPKARIIFSTNGSCPEQITVALEKILQTIKNIGVAVSLDGVGATHDFLRGVKNSFIHAILTIRLLKKIRSKSPTPLTIITPTN